MTRRATAAKVVRLGSARGERPSGERECSHERRISLGDGATATVESGALAVRDRDGRLLVRYADGEAEIAAPSGDLRLSAPHGRVAISSGMDVSIEAERDIAAVARRRVDVTAGQPSGAPALRVEPSRVEVRSPRVRVEAERGEAVLGEGLVIARTVVTTAERIAHHAERYEIEATRLFERTRDAFHDVADLCQSRIGRVRTVVRDAYALWSNRSTMVSKEDTSIDGKRVLLG